MLATVQRLSARSVCRHFSKKRRAARQKQQKTKPHTASTKRVLSRKHARPAWLRRHIRDEFVQQSKSDGYFSRAAYKLKEICQKHSFLLTPRTFVIDIGAAPGSWTQVACSLTGSSEAVVRVVSVDLLPLRAKLKGAVFVQGDFSLLETQEAIKTLFVQHCIGTPTLIENNGGCARQIDKVCILSDVRGNTTGNKSLDHFRQIELCDHVLDFSKNIAAITERLQPAIDVSLVAKVTMGSELKEFRDRLEKSCTKQWLIKPKSSRDSSAEIYIVAKNIDLSESSAD